MLKVGSRHKFSFLSKMLSPTEIHKQAKEKIVFSKGVSTGILNTLKGKPCAQQQMANTKLIQSYFCGLFNLYCSWVFFCLAVHLLVYYRF